MLNLDPAKLLVIAVVAIILLGPDRLPQVAKQVGAAWRSFNEFRHRMESEVRSTMPDLPPTSEIARLARSPSALLHHLSTMSDDEEGKEDAAAAADGTGAAGGTGSAGTAGVSDAAGAGEEADVEQPVAGNGAHAPAGENGSATEGAALEPGPAVTPTVPVSPTPAPVSHAQPPGPAGVPETTVPVDPSLN